MAGILALALGGCATVGGPTSAASGSAGSPPAYPSSSASHGSGAPFEQIIRGAQRQEGLLTVWRRQDKVWIELRPEDLGRPFFLSPKLATGIGEAGVFGGLLQSRWAQVGRPQWVEFRKVQQQVQLVAVNANYTAQSGTPQALAVAQAFSPSLLASVPVAGGPHPKSGAVLVDAGALMQADMIGMAQHLQRAYRQGYGVDARNSALLNVALQDKAMVFEVSQHFATSSISSGGGASASFPLSVPDPRSFFVTVHYTLSPLPAQPMATRRADPRVGYFATTVADFTHDLARTPRLRHINRWRLEKKDPDAVLSDPVRPIVYWLDPSIPEAYRGAIREGVLEWNKAFEAIGLRNAIEVRMPPPSGRPFDASAHVGHASIRWMTNSQPGFGAIGPTHVDPRTGEILHADIALESLSSRAIRSTRSQILAALPFSGKAAFPSVHRHGHGHAHDPGHEQGHGGGDAFSPTDACQHGLHAGEQLALALDVLQARGVLDPDGPDVQAFVLAYLKDTTMHEVGHTLGLRHNFRASRWRSAQALLDPKLGLEQGNSASVMDYTPINLPLPGGRMAAPFQTTLGPYDYWAIEYGYKALPQDARQADAMLQSIARRSEEPAWAEALAFGTDEDYAEGLDPHALVFDLGRDPIAYARTRLAIVRDLFERLQTRSTWPEDDAALPRRSVGYGLRELARTGQILLRQVGGVVTRRHGGGSPQDLLEPLPAAQQRAALDMLMKDFLSPSTVSLPPALQRRLAPDYLERQSSGEEGLTEAAADFSWTDQQLALQRLVLNSLMSESLAERLMDNVDKMRDRERRPLTPQELHDRLRQAVWQDTGASRLQGSARRDLQRDHVNRLAAAIVRNGSDRADVRALLRDEARRLVDHLRASKGGDRLAQAHRRDCVDTLTAALSATVMRTAP